MSKSMEGWVEKKANKWKKYYAVMIAKRMYFFKSDKTDDTEQMVGHLEIGSPDAVQAEETKKKYCVFSVASQTGVYLIKVQNEETRTRWIDAIRAGCTEDSGHSSAMASGPPPALPGNHPSLRKQISGGAAARPLPPAPTDASQSMSRLSSVNTSVTTVGDDFDNEEPFKSEPADGTPFSEASWHFGHTSRAVAEKLLLRHGSTGSFLLRASESRPGDYTLSVMDDKVPRHYKVLPQSSGGFVLTGCTDMVFDDLGKVVEYFGGASGQSVSLDKYQIEKMEVAFAGPSEVVQGAILPGMRIAMEMEKEMGGH